MAGLTPDTPVPTHIVVHRKSRELEIAFSDGLEARLTFEFLRVHSPSAEVRGHGPGQETLQTGKRDVDILAVEPVGRYAIQPRFSDGHESGIYSWDWLHRFAREHLTLWQEYLDRLEAAGASRDPEPLGREAQAAARLGLVPVIQTSGAGAGASAGKVAGAEPVAACAARSAPEAAPVSAPAPVPPTALASGLESGQASQVAAAPAPAPAFRSVSIQRPR